MQQLKKRAVFKLYSFQKGIKRKTHIAQQTPDSRARLYHHHCNICMKKFSFQKMWVGEGMNALGLKKKMGQIKLVCCEKSASCNIL